MLQINKQLLPTILFNMDLDFCPNLYSFIYKCFKDKGSLTYL